MSMLPLEDPRWRELNHRGWSNGARSNNDSDAPFVPEELSQLLEDPNDIEKFQNLWPYLCSEGTTWAAAYAAIPYIVEIAKRLSPEERFEHVYFVGLAVMCSCPDAGESFAIKPYLAESYERSLVATFPLLFETVACRQNVSDTRYLLASLAALKGHPKLGNLLNHLECIQSNCPKCGELVFPDEIQEVMGQSE